MGLGFHQNIAADGADYLRGTISIILVGVAAVGAVADSHSQALYRSVGVVCISDDLVGHGVGTLVLSGGDLVRPGTIVQLILHGAADCGACGDQLLSLAGVGQSLGSGGLGHNRSCFLNAPVQLNFAGVIAGALDRQLVSANIGCLISGHSIGDPCCNGDGLGLLLAGVGKASIQFHISLGDGLGLDCHGDRLGITVIVCCTSHGVGDRVSTCILKICSSLIASHSAEVGGCGG